MNLSAQEIIDYWDKGLLDTLPLKGEVLPKVISYVKELESIVTSQEDTIYGLYDRIDDLEALEED